MREPQWAATMDDVDRAIIVALREDARASFTAIAQQVGTSEGTVRARMKRLVADGTIRQFTIRTAGADVKALVEVTVEHHFPTDQVAKEIRSWDGIEAVWEVTGEKDILVVADCPTTQSLNALIDRVRTLDGADSTRSRLILKEH